MFRPMRRTKRAISDEDAKRYIRIFTLLDRETVEALTAEHEAAPSE